MVLHVLVCLGSLQKHGAKRAIRSYVAEGAGDKKGDQGEDGLQGLPGREGQGGDGLVGKVAGHVPG